MEFLTNDKIDNRRRHAGMDLVQTWRRQQS